MIDWSEYFKKIKRVCPWSYVAWNKKQIEIRNWDGTWYDFEDPDHLITIHIVKGLNRRRLKKLCSKLDVGDKYTWMWSEPNYGNYGAPTTILIQQLTETLENARKGLKEK